MTSILDFTINYRSDNEHDINKFTNSEPQIKKKFNLHFDSHFASCLYEGEFRGHFVFFSFKFTRQ